MTQLNDGEATVAYSELREILLGQGLEWVVEQVEATVALGKPERRRLTNDELPEDSWRWISTERSRRKGPAPVFVVAEEFTPNERLTLLAQAVRAAVVQPLAFAEALFELLPPSVAHDSVSFQPELESGRGFAVDATLIELHREPAANLNRLLDELLLDGSDAAPTRIAF